MPTARYWFVAVNNYEGSTVSLSEFQLWNSTTNTRQDATSTLQVSWPFWPPVAGAADNLKDNNTSTFVTWDDTYFYYRIDLGSSKEVDSFKIAANTEDGWPTEINVYYSEDPDDEEPPSAGNVNLPPWPGDNTLSSIYLFPIQYVISGVVLDEDDNPLPDIHLFLFERDTGYDLDEAYTDELGEFYMTVTLPEIIDLQLICYSPDDKEDILIRFQPEAA